MLGHTIQEREVRNSSLSDRRVQELEEVIEVPGDSRRQGLVIRQMRVLVVVVELPLI
jgi:hypothetical protein